MLLLPTLPLPTTRTLISLCTHTFKTFQGCNVQLLKHCVHRDDHLKVVSLHLADDHSTSAADQNQAELLRLILRRDQACKL